MRVLIGLFLALVLTAPAFSQAPPAPGSDAARLVGIWRLTSITEGGAVSPKRGGNPTGYIFYTASGHMGAQIQPDRAPVKMAGKELSEAEAKAALYGYTAYFGTYKIDEKAKVVTHVRYGSVQPGTEVDGHRAYRFESNDRLVIGGVGTTNQNTWERVRMEPLPAGDAAKLAGVWKLEAITLDGKVNPLRGAKPTGFIFYTATGEMGALIQPERPLMTKAGKETSGAEAIAALKGYTAYFGKYSLDETAKVATHHRAANVQPGQDIDVKRAYKLTPDGMKLIIAGVGSGNELVWERLK